MTQTGQPLNQSEALSPAARLIWLLLIVATLYFCYFHNLGVIGLVGPDEPRYAWIARDMAETGDWVTPRLYGKPWFEKPVLYYWGAALSFKLFGASEAAARLPSAIAALLATLAMAWLAWRIYEAETATWVLLLLPTTVGMVGFSHAAATDMPFAGMLTIAMVCGAMIVGLVPNRIDSSASKFVWLILFGVFLGLAVLAKGPAAIVLSGGAVLFWALFTKRWRDAFRCLHPVAIASFCATALPWYIVCARRNPEFFRIFIIEHNFKRYLTPEFQHVQPFWFYIPVVLIAFLPWTLQAISAIYRDLVRHRRRLQFSATSTFLLSWPVFCLLFFSLSKSKLPGYVLPAILPVGLLIVASCVKAHSADARPFRWIRILSKFLLLPAAVALAGLGKYAVTANQTEKMVSGGSIILLIAFANLMQTNQASPNRVLRSSAPFCVLPILVLLAAFGPASRAWLTPDPSAKSVAKLVEQLEFHLPASEFFVLPANRNLKYGLSFYLDRDVQFWDVQNPKEGFLLIRSDSDDCALHVKEPWHCSWRSTEFGSTGWSAFRIHAPLANRNEEIQGKH